MACNDTHEPGTNSAKAGNGGETHRTAWTREMPITTNHGVPVGDNQNSLKAGRRGPTLLEDFSEDPAGGFRNFARPLKEAKVRLRAETFADH